MSLIRWILKCVNILQHKFRQKTTADNAGVSFTLMPELFLVFAVLIALDMLLIPRFFEIFNTAYIKLFHANFFSTTRLYDI